MNEKAMNTKPSFFNSIAGIFKRKMPEATMSDSEEIIDAATFEACLDKQDKIEDTEVSQQSVADLAPGEHKDFGSPMEGVSYGVYITKSGEHVTYKHTIDGNKTKLEALGPNGNTDLARKDISKE